MKKFDVTITCMATYTGSIMVDDDATFEDALEEARNQLQDIPLGELEYIPDSDILDEENCSFDECYADDSADKIDAEENLDNEIERVTENKVIELWDMFDEKMRKLGYGLCVVDASVLNEEIEQFGKPMSCLGTTALTDDLFSPYIRLYISNDYKMMNIRVYDRNGSKILAGREVGNYKIKNISRESLEKAIEYIYNKYGSYKTGNYLPKEEKENIEF